MDVGGVSEMVRDGETGLLMQSRKEENVAHQIAKALEMEWKPDVMLGGTVVREWSEVARAQMQLMHEVVGQL